MIRRLILAVMLLSMCMFASPLPATAFDPFGQVDCSGSSSESNSAICNSKTSNDPISGTSGVLFKITNIISYIAGAAATILIIIGGLRYITSGGDSAKVASAKGTVINALVGIAIIVLARFLIDFVLRRV